MNALLWVPKKLYYCALVVTNWSREKIENLVNAITMILLILGAMMLTGLIIAKIGWAATEGLSIFGPNIFTKLGGWSSSHCIDLGKFVIGLTGLMAAFLSAYLWARVAILTEVFVLGNEAIRKLVEQASRPLPSTPIELPQLVTKEEVPHFLKFVMIGPILLTGLCVYASVVPVYTDLTRFCVCITLLFLVAFLSYRFDHGNSTVLSNSLIVTAVAIFLIYTLFYFVRPEQISEKAQAAAATSSTMFPGMTAEALIFALGVFGFILLIFTKKSGGGHAGH